MYCGCTSVYISIRRHWHDIVILLLLFKFIKRRHIEEVSQFVLKNISFFYIPYGRSIMESVGYLQGYMWQFALICIVSALLTFWQQHIP